MRKKLSMAVRTAITVAAAVTVALSTTLVSPAAAEEAVGPYQFEAVGPYSTWTADKPFGGDEVPNVVNQDSLFDVYGIEGIHGVNGRIWKTDCEPYSTTQRCYTEIWATTVLGEEGNYRLGNGWQFNNLTYLALPRAQWSSNPLGYTGSWVSEEGREWRTECDTAVSGFDGCRSYIVATVVEGYIDNKTGERSFRKVDKEVFNNIVRFGEKAATDGSGTVPINPPTPEPSTPVVTPTPTDEPTEEPTEPVVTPEPTEEPSEPVVTPTPTDEPTVTPTPEPSEPVVTPEPTEPTPEPSEEPTDEPTDEPISRMTFRFDYEDETTDHSMWQGYHLEIELMGSKDKWEEAGGDVVALENKFYMMLDAELSRGLGTHPVFPELPSGTYPVAEYCGNYDVGCKDWNTDLEKNRRFTVWSDFLCADPYLYDTSCVLSLESGELEWELDTKDLSHVSQGSTVDVFPFYCVYLNPDGSSHTIGHNDSRSNVCPTLISDGIPPAPTNFALGLSLDNSIDLNIQEIFESFPNSEILSLDYQFVNNGEGGTHAVQNTLVSKYDDSEIRSIDQTFGRFTPSTYVLTKNNWTDEELTAFKNGEPYLFGYIETTIRGIGDFGVYTHRMPVEVYYDDLAWTGNGFGRYVHTDSITWSDYMAVDDASTGTFDVYMSIDGFGEGEADVVASLSVVSGGAKLLDGAGELVSSVSQTGDLYDGSGGVNIKVPAFVWGSDDDVIRLTLDVEGYGTYTYDFVARYIYKGTPEFWAFNGYVLVTPEGFDVTLYDL